LKAVILAGGLGSRLSEETVAKPKPMVEIGGKPILWHIMHIFSAYGVNEFVLALGYRSEVIKEYFLNFFALNNNISVDFATGKTTIHEGNQPRWKVHMVDTGLMTMTGGRLRRVKSWLGEDETFMMTYGDGVADVDIRALLRFHEQHGKLATVTTVRPPARFGSILFDGNRVSEFSEKPQAGEGWINGGFFVLNRKVIDFVSDDTTIWERAPMERLASEGELMAYRHEGFWQPMDTLREKKLLDDLWMGGNAPWKVWS
jgi:glucose-1-phosphate cytidylyltransferase